MAAIPKIFQINWPRAATLISLAGFAGMAATGAAAIAGFANVDGLAVTLSLLTLFMATIVLGFSERHMRADLAKNAFVAKVVALAASIVAMFWATNLAVLAAAWIVSGRLLAALVGHLRGWDEADYAARRCTRSFLIGDLALIAAIALLALSARTLQMDTVLAAVPQLPTAIAMGASLLLLVAAAVRCALPPFSRWLLGSMSAPTPVSALMHGGFVNAGGFLLIRFAPLFTDNLAAQAAAIGLGSLAALYGTAIMLVRPDVKGALAGSTMSQMGFMILTCGLGAYGAALWHLIAHGLFKAALFLSAGSMIGLTVNQTHKPTLSQAAAVVVISVIAGLALTRAGVGAELVPLLVALATALTGVMTAGPRAAPLLPAAALLLIFSLAAAAAATRLVGVTHTSPSAPWQLALTALLLASWIAQLLVARRAPPARIYVQLLNAGAIHAR